jgi:hypothetical protein
LNSSRIETVTAGVGKKAEFGLNEYVGMFGAEAKQAEEESEASPPRQTGRVKIEYSPSSSESESAAGEMKAASFGRDERPANDSDAEDDFKW